MSADKSDRKSPDEFDLIRDIDQVIPIEVKEQRMSGLLQSLMIALCLRKSSTLLSSLFTAVQLACDTQISN